MTEPQSVTPIDGDPASVTERLTGARAELDESVLDALRAAGVSVSSALEERNEAGRDWWPLAIGWAARGQVPVRPAAIARPTSTDQVAAVLRTASAAGIAVTPAAGRSGVCGGAIPVFGGISLDLTHLHGLIDLDETSLVADVAAGTFGPDLEAELRARGEGYTLGHWPQSMDISTVGGWVACRGAGQYSTRYGKIEDMVLGLEVVLADGRVIHTDGTGPRAATGPNLTQLFVGSEGTLGVVTAARLRVHPVPPANAQRAYAFTELVGGLEVCRRMLRRGATPAVLRLYDEAESRRNFDESEACVLIVFDEADAGLVDATMAIVDEECARGSARRLDDALVERWLAERNDTSQLAPLWRAGIVVDTVEVAARWSVLPSLCDDVRAALRGIRGTLNASVHESHAYTDGACVYFTFAGRRPDDASAADMAWQEDYYRQAWDAVMAVTNRHDAAISHHHGIGLNRGRHLAVALGSSFEVLVALKEALDPDGILNPGKLGLPGPFGSVPWP
jgi:alkyldihydroxyacetonephosphate synthase